MFESPSDKGDKPYDENLFKLKEHLSNLMGFANLKIVAKNCKGLSFSDRKKISGFADRMLVESVVVYAGALSLIPEIGNPPEPVNIPDYFFEGLGLSGNSIKLATEFSKVANFNAYGYGLDVPDEAKGKGRAISLSDNKS